jgi:hypothetical protein
VKKSPGLSPKAARRFQPYALHASNLNRKAARG